MEPTDYYPTIINTIIDEKMLQEPNILYFLRNPQKLKKVF